MSVLKDASSAAIYGARAANGVVLITTKRGKEGTSSIRFSAYTGYSNLRKTVEVLTTKQYRALIEEIIPGALDPAATRYTDWQDETFGLEKTRVYQLAFSGGTEKMRYLLSTNYLNNEGIVKPARFDRYSVRSTSTIRPKDWLKIGTNINALRIRTKRHARQCQQRPRRVIMSALNTPPFFDL
jgi:TonB-dependent SusC/RagA subfamily outer membrane receptor